MNVNRYAFLDNKFPVEIFINYSGSKNVASRFLISKGGNTVFSKELNFSAENRSVRLEANLQAVQLGSQTYSAAILPMADEKNTINNKNDFAVDVIDERTSVLILSSIAHPDLGMLKKSIKANKQRKVTIKYTNENNINFSEYQLVIFYQPNNNFNEWFEAVNAVNSNYVVITGTQTNWNAIHKSIPYLSKNTSNEKQDFYAAINPNFKQFHFEDIGFSDFPPLQTTFGDLKINTDFEALLYQKIEGVNIEEPFNYSFIDEQFDARYKADEQSETLFKAFAGIAIFISSLGLFGLSTYTAQSRKKEIGIRKVLGANMITIVSLLSKDFLKLVFIAILIASPVAWWFMQKWLEGFAYRINLEWNFFLIAGLLAIGIALFTVSFQAIKAAIANPVKSLRTE